MNMKKKTEILTLMEQGLAHMDAGDYEKAEACLSACADKEPLPPVLENWAACRYYRGDNAGALEVLAPLLRSAEKLPFGRGLASLAQRALGRTDAALMALFAAVRDLDALRQSQRQGYSADQSMFAACSGLIIQAASELDRPKLVLELYARWACSDDPGATLLAGIAAFNLGRYDQASELWQLAARTGDDSSLADDGILIVDLIRHGAIAPFALISAEPALGSEAAVAKNGAETPPALNLWQFNLLAAMFSPEEAPWFGDDIIVPAKDLLQGTGAWGLELARRILREPRAALAAKLGALAALAAAESVAPGETVTLIGEKRTWKLTFGSLLPPEEPDDVRADYEAAMACSRGGQTAEAYRRLKRLCRREPLHPLAMLMLSSLMRERGEYDAAMGLLDALEAIAPDEPRVLASLAALYSDTGDDDLARDYLRRINPGGVSPMLAEYVSSLWQALDEPLSGTSIPGYVADALREQQEDKTISREISLASALKRVPVEWLDAAAHEHGVPTVKRRPDRERALATALLDMDHLTKIVSATRLDLIDALQTVLTAGGWCKLQKLTHAYGAQDGDGFWWDEEAPYSVIGLLRFLGFLYVGRANVDGKRHKVAVIPVELREPLAAAIARARAAGESEV